MQEKRKTINGDDLLWAMSTLGFDKYVEPLKLYLAKYREAVRGDKPDKGGISQGVQGVGRPSTSASNLGNDVGMRSGLNVGLPLQNGQLQKTPVVKTEMDPAS